jgi:fumarylacetoacetase
VELVGAGTGPVTDVFGPDDLPYGVFSVPGSAPRVGVRLGDAVVDLAAALGTRGPDAAFCAPTLDAFMAQGRARWVEVRERAVALARGGVPPSARHPLREVVLHLPFTVGDFVDFSASEHHATNVGRLLRPGTPPLHPNWKHLPVGYHGRAGSVVVSGTDVIRPSGQRLVAAGPGSRRPPPAAPSFGPSTRLDVEAEVGFVVGTGTPRGAPIPVDAFAEHVFGAVLVNDWSARDIQAWEYVPLGPFLGKSFATSVSAWVVPLAALEAARVPLPAQDPLPSPHLRGTEPWGLDIELALEWNGEVVARPPYREMYWSPAQMLAHLTSNGASARTGDLIASGTVSGPAPEQWGSFLELTAGGPISVNGEERTFLLDGDEVVITASAPRAGGGRVAFGEVRGRVLPADFRQPGGSADGRDPRGSA